MFDEFVSRPDVMVFAVSRDPFSRALAGYLDKVVTGTPIFDTVKEELASIRGTDVDAVTPESVSFAEHLTALEMKPGSLAMNAHFRPQAAHIGFGATPFTHVFRIEEFTALESALADHLGVDNFRVGRTGAHATNSAQRLGDYYGPSTIKQVLRLFADDFDAFGYPRKLAESR